jgi:hypothetical protein
MASQVKKYFQVFIVKIFIVLTRVALSLHQESFWSEENSGSVLEIRHSRRWLQAHYQIVFPPSAKRARERERVFNLSLPPTQSFCFFFVFPPQN